MPSTFQRQSRLRKIVYSVLILVLLTGTLLWRSLVVETQAQNLRLREQDLGEVELTGKTVQVVSTGMRGFAVCVLWMGVIEEQKRHEWPEMELLVNSLTTLQPHLIRPWLFQSWNLSYNVSVISDQSADQYFYVTRGMELLARGERQNVNDPDLRFSMGHMYQNKLGQGDKRREFRALFELSCIDLHTELNIDPRTRKSRTLRSNDGKTVNVAEFKKFADKHPQLVRRIRQIKDHETAEDVVDFLESNAKVPSRFEYVSGAKPDDRSELKSPTKRFPILPRDIEEKDPPRDPKPDNSLFDNFAAARIWYVKALEPLPPPDPAPEAGIPTYDRRRYRMPRYMRAILFRAYPAHAQTYLAKALQQEGWFDRDGWTLTDPDGFPGLRTSSTEPADVVGKSNWGRDSWERTHEMWKEFGKENGVYIEPKDLENLQAQARPYREAYQINPEHDPPRPLPQEARVGRLEESYHAYRQLYAYRHNRTLTNFAHFYNESLVEEDPQTVMVRKHLDRAKRLQELGKFSQALEIYVRPGTKELEKYPEPRTIEAWKQILLDHPEFHRDPTLTVQEETFRVQLNYLRLALPEYGVRLLPLLQCAAQATQQPPMVLGWSAARMVADVHRQGLPSIRGPFDIFVTDEQSGQLVPLIGIEARGRVQRFLPGSHAAAQVQTPQRPPTPGARGRP
jgi:hypothetical protein